MNTLDNSTIIAKRVVVATTTPPGTGFVGICEVPIGGLSPFFELRAHAGSPAYVCAMVLGNSRRLKIDAGGTQTFGDLDQDT